jgi:hypothetical protein
MSDTEFRKLVRETVGVERAMELRLLESVMGKSVYYNLSEPEPDDEDKDEDEPSFLWKYHQMVTKPKIVFA